MTDYSYQPTAPPDYGYPPPQDTNYPPPVAPPSVDPGYPPAYDTNYPPSNYPNYPPPQDLNYPPPPPVAGPGYNPQYPPNVGAQQYDQTYPTPTHPGHGYAPNKAPRQPPPRASHQAKTYGQQAKPARNPRPKNAVRNPRYPPPQVPRSHYQPVPPVMQSQTTNVVVVNSQPQAPCMHQQVIIQERRHVNHILHFLLTILFPPWIFIWFFCCIIYGC